MRIPVIKSANLTYRHNFRFQDERKNHALAILSVDLDDSTGTEQLLQLLSEKARLSVREGTILSRAQAEAAGLLVLPKP